MTMRSPNTTSRLLGMAAHAAGAHRWGAATGWRAVLFHHICDGVSWHADSPYVQGLGVSLEKDAFVDCVRYLAETYDVVALSEVVPTSGADASRHKPRHARRRVVICFDDAYASVATLAAPVLADLGLPWCFFINPNLVGNSRLAADNAVAYVANTSGLAPLSRAAGRPVSSVGEFVHSEFALRRPEQRRQLVSELLREVGADAEALARDAKLYVEADDVRRLADAGVEIGNHTADHVHCRNLDAEDSVREQVCDSAKAVAVLAGQPVRAFAYPYGNLVDRTDRLTAALRESGHECAFVVHNRANTRRTDPFGLYRVSLNTGDPRHLSTELEVLPRLRAARAALREIGRRAYGQRPSRTAEKSDRAAPA